MHPLSLPLASLFLLAQPPAADGWLGVYLANDREAPVVAEVIPESPAARAGIQTGDELLAVGDTATPKRADAIAAIRGHQAGERLAIKLRRDGKELRVVVVLGERPESLPTPAPVTPPPPKRVQPPAPGGEVAPPPAADAPRKAYLGLRVRETDVGVVVDEALPDGPASSLGIRQGERILSLGDQQVRRLADLDAVLQRSQPGRRLPITLQSDAGVRSLTLTLGEMPGAGGGHRPAPVEPPPPVPTEPPKRPIEVKPPAPPAQDYDVEREIEALRRELQELRRQLEQMREQERKGRQ